MIAQGDIWWADLGEPVGSAPGYRRPVLIVQNDSLNRSRMATTVCVPMTGNMRWANAPGNVLLRATATGLSRDSVAIGSQIIAVDRILLQEQAERVERRHLDVVFAGIDAVLGR